jgi:hypothetical protein
MRRVVSISVLFGLFATMFFPLLMAAKMQSDDCPLLKIKGHRCDQMMAQMAHRASQTGSTSRLPSISSGSIDGKCPVECVMANSANHSITASVLTLSPLVVTRANRAVSFLSFVSVGSSQHTDRGPPAVELPA